MGLLLKKNEAQSFNQGLPKTPMEDRGGWQCQQRPKWLLMVMTT